MGRFSGKTVVLTGAGSGIGAAMAKRFAADGANVVGLDISKVGLDPVIAEITAAGGNAIGCVTDVTNEASVCAAAKAAVDRFGSIDAWINCAGYSRIVPMLECTDEIWNNTININLKGCFYGCRAAVRQMLKQEKGAIVNISSESGKRGGAQYQAYCASKFGIIGMTQSIAQEFAKQGIRANCVCPGVVPTPMWDKQRVDYARKRNIAPEDVMAYFCNKIPMGRICSYDDLYGIISFLASDDSKYMTGQALNATGGSTMY